VEGGGGSIRDLAVKKGFGNEKKKKKGLEEITERHRPQQHHVEKKTKNSEE